ncbi:MAG: cell division protein SepF [Actinomycetaceae bacterium]|nr:cell division protein SepF [Actinomycetaceae bacterium]MDU0970047.1 cell division protein SepF [Actinomycetaceae bacterium]
MAGTLKKAMTFMGLHESKADMDDELYDGYESEGDDYSFTPSQTSDFSSGVTPFPTPQVVADSSGDIRRIHTVRPKAFNDAVKIADVFRGNTPVILSLEAVRETEARRLLDFASGLVYGLQGHMTRVGSRVYLLSPHEVAVDGSEDDSLSGLLG